MPPRQWSSSRGRRSDVTSLLWQRSRPVGLSVRRLRLRGIASAQTPPPYVYSSPLLPLLLQMPQNSWLLANANLYSDVWTPDDLEPLLWMLHRSHRPRSSPRGADSPGTAIAATSSCSAAATRITPATTSIAGTRATCCGSARRCRAKSRPTRCSGKSRSMASITRRSRRTHTTTILFLPVADRFLTWGGAAFNNGGPFIRPLESNPTTQTRLTGPYLFDPNRADGNKVGGTTGSHVQRVAPHPEIVGGQMWQNRDIHYWLAGQPLPGTHIDGCTGNATEGGRDVVYVASAPRYSTGLNLYRYQLNDLANPAADQIAMVGAYAVGVSGQTTCGYDPVRKVFVRTGNNTVPFQFWDLTNAGPTNPDQNVQVNASIAALQSWLSANSHRHPVLRTRIRSDPRTIRALVRCRCDLGTDAARFRQHDDGMGRDATSRSTAAGPSGRHPDGRLGEVALRALLRRVHRVAGHQRRRHLDLQAGGLGAAQSARQCAARRSASRRRRPA